MVDIGSSTDYREEATTASGLARLGPGAVGTYLHPLDERTAGRWSGLGSSSN